MKTTVEDRLQDADLSKDRYVSVQDGSKACVDHDTRYNSPPGGNYGIYASATDELLILDVDDYDDIEDKSGLTALTKLEPTLEVGTPHGGTHKFYRVSPSGDGRLIAAVLKDEFGTSKGNVAPSWGEVRVANQYVVGAGSSLTSCSKDWHDCSDDGEGDYEIGADREIATVDADTVVAVLSEDPDLSTSSEEDSEETDGEVEDPDDVLDYALNESDDEKLKRLWRGDYSDYGGDRSEAESALAYKLAFWLQGDKQEVRRAMDRADLKKWPEREDGSYRESVLEAVDKCNEYFEPTETKERAPSYNEDEVERAEDLLQAECGPEDPAGEMVHRNGQYGYWWEKREDGELVEREFQPVTNFTLETLEHLKTDDSELLRVRVHPAHPMGEEYEIEIHPTVFNETRTFKEEVVRGKTTRYEPGQRNQQALNDLRETVGAQMVATRIGSEHIGLCGDEYSEWVTPKGTLDESGAADDPEYRYYAKGGASDSDGGALARKWQLDPETVGDYETDDVAQILELLPQTRRHDRGLPILGWFYAAPLRPLIHDWEGEFNLLQVVGSTGTGKTSTLKAYWEAFGMQPDPFSASDTPFTLMKHMASSSGVPVWIDEYKPADIRSDRLDTLHRRLREVTKGTAVSKGLPNLGEVLFQIKAPVVVSGEQKFSQSVPAVRRRSIMTTLSEEPTTDGSSYTEAFSKLTGTAFERADGSVQYPSGYDLSDHARAYYTFLLSQDGAELEELWNQCREDTGDLLADRDLSLEPTEFQGAQTILFGVRVYRKFAETVGADLSALPAESEVGDAFEHFASNIGKDGQRRGYDDTFLELFAQAVGSEYITEEEDFRFVESQKWGTEVLAFHMPSVYAGVKRYVRDYNLDGEYNIIGKPDYLSAFKDKSEKEHSHVLKTNHKTRLEGGPTKCVVIDPELTKQKLGSDFDLRSVGFTTEEEDEEGDNDDGDGPDGDSRIPFETENLDSAAENPTGHANIAGEVLKVVKPENESAPALKATVSDDTTAAELVHWSDSEIVKEGDEIAVKNSVLDSFDGTTQFVVDSSVSEVVLLKRSVGEDPDATDLSDGNGSEAAATDGGDSVEDDGESHGESEEFVETPDDELEKVEKPDVAGVTVPEDALGAEADARRIAQYLDERSTAMAETVLRKTMTLDVDLMTPKEFNAALEKGIKEMGILKDGCKLKRSL